MAELWSGDQARSHHLKRVEENRYKAKKKTYGYRERDEDKRREFLKQLATVKPELIVYADEAGMDERDDYGYGYSPQGERFYDFKKREKNRAS